MKTVQFKVAYKEKAGRLELLVRLLWSIPTAIVAAVLLMIGGLAGVMQILHILILGRRHRALYDWTHKLVAYLVKYECYKNLLTDERSPIMPED